MKKLLHIFLFSLTLLIIESCKKDVPTTLTPVIASPVVIPVQISIYPNPCDGHFTIQTNATTSQDVKLIDMLGRVKLHQIITGTTIIDVDSLISGVYYVEIITIGNTTTKKLIITQ